MIRSNTSAVAFSLGLLSSLASAGDSYSPQIRVIEIPQELQYVNTYFSSDGSTVAIAGESPFAWDIYIHGDEKWKLVSRSVNETVPGPWIFGLSDDGSALLISDDAYTSIYQDGSTTFMPKLWYEPGGVSGQGRAFFSGAISGDGSAVGYSPRPADSDDNKPVLVWRGERHPEVLLADPEENGIDYQIISLNTDGSVALAGAKYSGPHNNIRRIGTMREAWVIDQGEFTMVPPLDLPYQTFMRATEISGNGLAVIGRASGIWRVGFEDDNALYTESSQDFIYSPQHSWVWTSETGTIEIERPALYESIGVWDITDDASVVLGAGYTGSGEDVEVRGFLWFRELNRFVNIDDLFTKLGIVIDADSYSFSQISGDGSKLMGSMHRDGQQSAIIVTIPAG